MWRSLGLHTDHLHVVILHHRQRLRCALRLVVRLRLVELWLLHVVQHGDLVECTSPLHPHELVDNLVVATLLELLDLSTLNGLADQIRFLIFKVHKALVRLLPRDRWLVL